MRSIPDPPGGRTELFVSEGPAREMLSVLFRGDGETILRLAEADDAVLLAQAAERSREDGVPLLLYADDPGSTKPPDGVRCAVCARSASFAELLSTASELLPASREARTGLYDITWDETSRTVRRGADAVRLTEREAEVFGALFAASPEPVPRGTLCASFRRTSGNGAEVYISYLRRDLAAFPLKIVSVRGRGYALLRCAD